MQPARAKPCKSMAMLRSHLQADVSVYMKAVQLLEEIALDGSADDSFKEAIRDVRVARDAFFAARRASNEHIATHDCV